MGDPIGAARARCVAAFAASALLVLAAGCGGSAPQQLPVAQRLKLPHDRWSYGRKIFRIDCAACHTLADAGAHGRRSDLDASTLASSPHAAALARRAVIYGAPGMPRWRIMLRPQEIRAVARYVAAVVGKPAPPRPPVSKPSVPKRRDRFSYARALFDELCSGCHRLADAGAQIGTRDMDHSPLSYTTQRPELADFVMTMGYHAGLASFGGMPSYKGVLSEREFNALVTYVATVAGRPGALTPAPRTPGGLRPPRPIGE